MPITKEDVIKDPNLMFDFLSQPSVDTGTQSEAERLYEQEIWSVRLEYWCSIKFQYWPR